MPIHDHQFYIIPAIKANSGERRSVRGSSGRGVPDESSDLGTEGSEAKFSCSHDLPLPTLCYQHGRKILLQDQRKDPYTAPDPQDAAMPGLTSQKVSCKEEYFGFPLPQYICLMDLYVFIYWTIELRSAQRQTIVGKETIIPGERLLVSESMKTISGCKQQKTLLKLG